MMDWKEDDWARGTHTLKMAEGWTHQEHRKKVNKQRALTIWRPEKEGHVKVQKESNQVRGTYKREPTE